MCELKNRGVEDILIAVVDSLKGFPHAVNAAFPKTAVQTCTIHLLRGEETPNRTVGGHGAGTELAT